MDDLLRLRTVLGGALDAARRGDDDQTLFQFATLVSLSDDSLRTAVIELASANAEMLRGLAGLPDAGSVLGVDLFHGDGTEVEIDNVEPSLRVAIRILLAVGHGHPADVGRQLDVVDDAHDPAEMGLVLVHTLMWSVQLMDACDGAGQPIPTWIEHTAVSG
jgi:hypothetical protein